ncbi:hypothetical protein [Dyella sp.]|uniref:GTP-binding protein n=1 Tax=Dyella sp. TaxID=1869338 RepID=UPI002ED326EA
MEKSLKFVLAGPVGVGKTTAIGVLGDAGVISTDVPMTQSDGGQKTTTTVALDFASVALDHGPPLFIYGLPGQDHFSFMRPILLHGALGVILLLRADSPDLIYECSRWIEILRSIDDQLAIVIGITHADRNRDFSIQHVREALPNAARDLPVFTFDARDRDQVEHLIRALLVTIG